MASIFTQTCQPQLAAAASHLSSLLGGARVLSTNHRDRSHNTKTPQLRHTHSRSAPTKAEDQHKNQPEEVTVASLSDLLQEARVQTPITAQVERARGSPRTEWAQCHTSAQSFFENRTGFPKSELTSPHPALHLFKDPLFRRFFSSLAGQHGINLRGFKTLAENTSRAGMHQRSFKTMRSENVLGMGSHKDEREERGTMGDSLKEMLGASSSSSSSSSWSKRGADDKNLFSGQGQSDAELERQFKLAFSAGFKAGRDTESKSKRTSLLWSLLLLASVLYIGLKMFGGSVSIKGGGFGFSPYEVSAEDVNVTFADVKGAAEAKQELQDVVNFLRDPEKYTALGAKLPKGVLLVGPPGVGKTLLARAVAGEAGVPYFHASGSEFDELFVGLGAKRIRQLFSAAKAQAPCIIFIDEFDSVGAKRTSSAVHPYANQTVNQLLSEMDGFQQNEGIIVMGATNKVDNMDKALRRPGRFDVEVTVSLPDLKGRKEIIELYISKIKKDSSVDVDKLARGTTGFSGAELENLVNQAALKAVIDGDETVTMEHLEFARDKIIMGPERKQRIPDEDTNWVTAYHEAGHTLVAHFTKDATPLHKVTIIPRGQSLGHTSFLDDKEVYNRTVSQLKASMDTAMGGRAAEELVYGPEKVTTGAGSDLQQATRVATAMVMVSGMSEKVGLRSFSDAEISPAQRELIDNEIKRLLQESYERARTILKQHSGELTHLATALMKHETLDKEEITAVIKGQKINRP